MVKRPRLVDIINGKCIKEDVYKFFKDDKTEDPSEIEANDPKEADDKIKRITGQDPTKVTKWKDDDEEGALGEADNVFQSKLNDIFETSDSMYDDEFDLVEDFNTTSNLDGGEGQPRTPFAFRKKRTDEAIAPGGKKLIPLNEVNYNEWVEDDSATPKQKINKALWEISKGLYEFDRLLNRAKKLKNEIGADQTVYWKRTSEKFSKINERLLKVSSKIREMNQC